MTVKVSKNQQPLVDPKQVDESVNAVFTAFTRDLDRPFVAGGRNVRAIVKQWDPLSHDPTSMDLQSFHHSYVSAHFFDRYFYSDEVGQSRNLEAEALKKFKANLSRGLVMNNYVFPFLPFGRLNTILCSASLEVGRILGEFSLEELFRNCAHGPNATLDIKRQDAYVPNKARSLQGTLPAISLFKEYLEWNFHLKDYLDPLLDKKEVEFTVVAGSRLSFVPKKFDSLRTMSIEPTINQFLQQGLGNVIRNRLKKYGNIDLENQSYVHTSLVGTIAKHDLPIATIDWSQASDRIWLGLCQKLLPSDWFAVLEDVRSPVTTYNGEELTLTMAGSMGCGFTFPLQTLLFLCLLRACARENGHESFVTVFGDDCICDSSMKDDITVLAKDLDWQMNADKSFFEGPFRESCGRDSFRGLDCRPFFIERPDDTTSPHALCAWAYGVFNLASAVVSRCGNKPYALAKWLEAFVTKLGYEVLLVPLRFSEQSGVRVKDPHDTSLFSVHAVSIVLENYFYPYCGYHFTYLGQIRKVFPVEQEPYYLLALEGKGIPQDFKSGRIDPDEESCAQVKKKPGHVPRKEKHIGLRTGFVHSWTYFSC